MAGIHLLYKLSHIHGAGQLQQGPRSGTNSQFNASYTIGHEAVNALLLGLVSPIKLESDTLSSVRPLIFQAETSLPGFIHGKLLQREDPQAFVAHGDRCRFSEQVPITACTLCEVKS